MSSRSADGYRIIDEPAPSGLARFAVDPMWPVLAMFMAGTVLGGSWLVFNAFAIGSATRRKEAAVIAATAVAMFAALVGLNTLSIVGGVDLMGAGPYLLIGFRAARMVPAYFVHDWQGRSFALFE